MENEMIAISVGLVVLLAWAIYSFTKSNNELAPLDTAKIKAEVDAITDLAELQQYAVNCGVESIIISRLSFIELKKEIYNLYNLK